MSRTVKITKNPDTDKYFYSGYGIGFNSRSLFAIPNFDWGKNIVILGIDMRSSVHIDNKGKDILIILKGPTVESKGTTFTAEVEYSINFSRSSRKLCSSLHFNGINSFLFVNATKIYQFKAKDSEINKYPLCLGNISKIFTANKMKKTGLNGYIYEFSVDYNIIDIHKYLMKKYDIKNTNTKYKIRFVK